MNLTLMSHFMAARPHFKGKSCVVPSAEFKGSEMSFKNAK